MNYYIFLYKTKFVVYFHLLKETKTAYLKIGKEKIKCNTLISQDRKV